MTIKQLGGVFGRNPTFNDVTIEGELTFNGDIDIGSDLKINGDLEVTGTGKIDDLIVGATSAPQAGVNLEVKSATSELRLSTSDGSINNGETIGKITWNAPDEGSGPNAIIVAGEISLVSDGNWDSTRYTPSNIVFKTTPVNGPTMVEAARFTSTGNLAFPSGQGIDFSATAGTGTSELLDDYEEGAFSPVVAGTSTAGTYSYSVQVGRYTKIGDCVRIDITLSGITADSAGSGSLKITGLPYSADGTNVGPVWARTLNFDNTAAYLVATTSGTNLFIYEVVDNAAGSNVNVADISSGNTLLAITLTYKV
jgi:hypothetical protein